MAKKLKVGDVVRDYRVTKVFGPGMMAISYAAQNAAGAKVFLKQYKSPAPTVIWYREFLAYQKELSSRVRNGKAAHLAVRQLDAFEERWGGPCYFQAYEFVENGADLQQILDAERERHRLTKAAPTGDPDVWARHVTWAKVLIAAVASLHASKVVHADLKPANAYLVEDATIGSGYQLKLIDMDFSLLSDRKAPWHGFQGYVGTDNYRSPEHMQRGGVPGTASDVFTCGLMLYELLAGQHPYWSEDQSEYARRVMAYEARPPALVGTMPLLADNARVSAALHRCLSPDPLARPTAEALRAILSGREPRSESKSDPHPVGGAKGAARGEVAKDAPIPTAPKRAAGNPILSEKLELNGAYGRSLAIGVRTELGKALVRQFGPDGDYWDALQCVVERRSGRPWSIVPIEGTTNETLVNGETLKAPRELRDGDAIAVGRQAKGIVKMPLTVQGR